jgi:hypothetical protein
MLLHVTRLPHLDQPSLDVKETVNKILKTELETETLMKFFNLSYLVPGKEKLTIRVECNAVDVSAVTGQLLQQS